MKVLFYLLTCFITITGHAQLTERVPGNWTLIGKVKFGGITKASLEYKNSGTDTTYILFVNAVKEEERKREKYFSVVFKSADGTLGKFYSILKSFFLPENKKNKNYSRSFDLGNTFVNISYNKTLFGNWGITFYTKEGYANWSEKDIDKLFGYR